MFDPFFQADTSTTRRFGGTGLGLAICHNLVELMDGSLSYDSQPGHGSTFRFDLSLPPVRSREPDPNIAGSMPACADQPHDPLVASAQRALVVDDVAVNQLVASAMLQNLGYQIDTGADGTAALAAVRTNSYDVVLMDCLMPVMDGYEATARIRSLEGPNRHTYIIGVTAAATTRDRQKCRTAGMDDFVAKPIDPTALQDALARSKQVTRSN
jgi:two-component system, sensor histidine kinase and response regulator